MLPNYYDNKKDDNEYENSSNCYPNDLITVWQRSVPGKRSRGEKVKTKKSRNLKGIFRGKVIAFAVYMVVARIKRNEL